MENYKKNRQKSAKQLKEEISMIKYNKKIVNNERVETKK